MDNGTCLELQNQFQSVPNGVLDNDLSDMIETIAGGVQSYRLIVGCLASQTNAGLDPSVTILILDAESTNIYHLFPVVHTVSLYICNYMPQTAQVVFGMLGDPV